MTPFVVIRSNNVSTFTEHINNINPAIKFTIEREKEGKIAMLDTLVHRQENGTLITTVYRKPTHTDQYLAFDSHHPLQHKLGVTRTLMHRAKTVVTHEKDREVETKHLKDALKTCGYGDWTFQVAQATMTNKIKDQRQSKRDHNKTVGRPFITIPYIRGTSEALRRVFNKHGVTVHFKPKNTLRELLVSPKDKTDPKNKCGIVYQNRLQTM